MGKLVLSAMIVVLGIVEIVFVVQLVKPVVLQMLIVRLIPVPLAVKKETIIAIPPLTITANTQIHTVARVIDVLLALVSIPDIAAMGLIIVVVPFAGKNETRTVVMLPITVYMMLGI